MDNFYIKDSDEDGIQIQALLAACIASDPNIIRETEYNIPHDYESFNNAVKSIKKNAEELKAEIWEIRKRINDLRSFLLQYEFMEDYDKDLETKMYIELGSISDYSNYIDKFFEKYPNIPDEQ